MSWKHTQVKASMEAVFAQELPICENADESPGYL